MTTKSAVTKNIWTDPDDTPELTDEWFESADLRRGERLVRRGRPAGSGVKASTTVRLDRDILETFRASGKGWQTRLNDALRDWLKTHSPVS